MSDSEIAVQMGVGVKKSECFCFLELDFGCEFAEVLVVLFWNSLMQSSKDLFLTGIMKKPKF